MNERMSQWMAEKPQGDWGNELRLSTGDIVYGQFVASGEDGDKYIKIYRSHIVDRVTRTGKHYGQAVYCPIHSGESESGCPLCEQSYGELKERMSMWFDISTILRAQMPQGENQKPLPQVQSEGRIYFQEDIQNFRIWHASAWRESPWQDICKLNEIYQGLHNFAFRMDTVGRGMETRYKIYAIPNSQGISEERYQQAQEACRVIPEILREQIGAAIQLNPGAQQPASANVPQFGMASPFVPPGTSAPPFTPFAGSPTVNPDSGQPAEDGDTRRPMQKLF